MNRHRLVAVELNPPTFKIGDKCCVAGPDYFQALGPFHQRPQKYNNHGKVIEFDAMFNTYLVQLIGIPDMSGQRRKPTIKVKTEYVDKRLFDDGIDNWIFEE